MSYFESNPLPTRSCFYNDVKDLCIEFGYNIELLTDATQIDALYLAIDNCYNNGESESEVCNYFGAAWDDLKID